VKSDSRYSLVLKSIHASIEVELTTEAWKELADIGHYATGLKVAGMSRQQRAEVNNILDELIPQFGQTEDNRMMQRVSKESL
jgi:hypothetical protein